MAVLGAPEMEAAVAAHPAQQLAVAAEGKIDELLLRIMLEADGLAIVEPPQTDSADLANRRHAILRRRRPELGNLSG